MVVFLLIALLAIAVSVNFNLALGLLVFFGLGFVALVLSVTYKGLH